MDRPWDKENKYTKAFLKAYTFWTLEVNYRQPTLGCFIIFCNRDIKRISEATKEEMSELIIVMKEIELALEKNKIFKPDLFNYWQMGNKPNHLHFHGIPRYKSQRTFLNKNWIDESFGTVPIWSKIDQDDEIISKIKESILKNL